MTHTVYDSEIDMQCSGVCQDFVNIQLTLLVFCCVFVCVCVFSGAVGDSPTERAHPTQSAEPQQLQ